MHDLSLFGEVSQGAAHAVGGLAALFRHPRVWLSGGALIFTAYRWWRAFFPATNTRPSGGGLLRRLWLGKWLKNEETGEWERITGKGPHGAIVDARGWSRRYVEDVVATTSRRRHLIGLPLGALACIAVLANYTLDNGSFAAAIFGHGSFFYVMSFFIIVSCVLCIVMAGCMFLGYSVQELFYQSNFQHMANPKTIDPRPPAAPGLDGLINQPAYEKGGAALPRDLNDILNPMKNSNPQRFKD